MKHKKSKIIGFSIVILICLVIGTKIYIDKSNNEITEAKNF